MRLAILSLLATLLSTASVTPAFAEIASFTGTLTHFNGAGTGLGPAVPGVTGSGSANYDTVAFSFTVPSSVFATNRTTPVPGFTPNASPNSIYIIGQVANQSNGAGSFGPGGGFGGTMNTGLDVTVQLGIVPLPNVFGSVPFPLNVGVPGTVVDSFNISANVVTVS